MSEIALDRTVWSGFRLTRKHPAAFGLWVLIDLVLGLGPTALLMAILGPNFFDLVRSSAESSSKLSPPGAGESTAGSKALSITSASTCTQ